MKYKGNIIDVGKELYGCDYALVWEDFHFSRMMPVRKLIEDFQLSFECSRSTVDMAFLNDRGVKVMELSGVPCDGTDVSIGQECMRFRDCLVRAARIKYSVKPDNEELCEYLACYYSDSSNFLYPQEVTSTFDEERHRIVSNYECRLPIVFNTKKRLSIRIDDADSAEGFRVFVYDTKYEKLIEYPTQNTKIYTGLGTSGLYLDLKDDVGLEISKVIIENGEAGTRLSGSAKSIAGGLYEEFYGLESGLRYKDHLVLKSTHKIVNNSVYMIEFLDKNWKQIVPKQARVFREGGSEGFLVKAVEDSNCGEIREIKVTYRGYDLR
jgi:hypothetical protein